MKRCNTYIWYFKMGIILWMLSPFFVYGQLLEPVTFQIDEDQLPGSVKAGELFTVTIKAEIEDQWYLYSIHNKPDDGPIPTMFASEGTEMIIAGDIDETAAERKFDPNFGTELGLHSGTVSFMVPVRFRHNLSGKKKIKLNAYYQACDDRSCLPPREVFLTGLIVLNEGTGEANFLTEKSDFGTGTYAAGRRSQESGEENNRTGVYILLISVGIVVMASLVLIRYSKKR
jgi:hypothetical protein